MLENCNLSYPNVQEVDKGGDGRCASPCGFDMASRRKMMEKRGGEDKVEKRSQSIPEGGETTVYQISGPHKHCFFFALSVSFLSPL